MKTIAGSEHIEVLYVEDEPSDSLLISRELQTVLSPRVDLTTVTRLTEALEQLGQKQFDVVLLDLKLPDSQGMASVERIRAVAPALPLIVLSGLDDSDLALHAVRNGVQDYLLKGQTTGRQLVWSIQMAIERNRVANDLVRRAQQRAESEAQIRAIIEASADAAVIVDQEGLVQFVNQAALTMFSREAEELLGHPFGFPVIKDRSTEVDIIRKDGTVGIAEMRVADILWCKRPACLASLRDITERKRSEQAQLRSQKLEALGTLAGGIAHDFNNLLLAIVGNAQLAIADLPPQHPAQESLAEITKAGNRATELVKRILAFSRPQDQKCEIIHLQPVIAEVLKLVRATLPAMIEMRTDFQPDVPAVSADAGQIHQVIVNLATNAAHAIGQHAGLIEFRLEALNVDDDLVGLPAHLPGGRYVRLSVFDSGSGMDQNTQQRIFDPFFTTKPMGVGTGLGLSIVNGIMNSHGGTINVYSELGKGTVFRLYFPVAEKPDDEAKSPEHAEVSRGYGEHILYIDDDQALVFLATRVLKRLGYRVTGYTSATEALAVFQSRPEDFDLLVTDLSMPEMSGFELAQSLLRLRPDLPIVMTSGYLRPDDQETARRIGIRELILKPNTVDEVGRAIDRLFRDLGGLGKVTVAPP